MRAATTRVLLFLAVATLLGIGVALAFVHPRLTMPVFAGDDAGYYLAIVRNTCLGHGFSFDRLHPTNGFNPLVPLLLVPAFALARPGFDVVTCYRIGTLATWLFVVLAGFPLAGLVSGLLERRGVDAATRRLAVAAALWFLAGFVAMKSYYGMDAFLVLALGLFYYERVSRQGLLAPGAGAALVDGGLLGLLFLARLDSLPLVFAALGLGGIAVIRGAGTWRPLFARVAVFALVVVPVLAWGQLTFGSWLPVSARIKNGFPHVDLARSLATVTHTSLNRADLLAAVVGLVVGITVVLFAVPALVSRARAQTFFEDRPRVAVSALAAGLAARLLWLFVFSRFDVQASYFVLVHPFLALVLFWAASRIPAGRALPAASVALALVTFVLVAGKVHAGLPRLRAVLAGYGDDWATARRIHDLVGPHEVVYGGAYGMIGFAADCCWINGDGVANDFAYQEALRDHRLADYLRENRVRYVACARGGPMANAPVDSSSFSLVVGSGLYGVADSIALDGRDLVVRSWSPRGRGNEFWLLRWTPPDRPEP